MPWRKRPDDQAEFEDEWWQFLRPQGKEARTRKVESCTPHVVNKSRCEQHMMEVETRFPIHQDLNALRLRRQSMAHAKRPWESVVIIFYAE